MNSSPSRTLAGPLTTAFKEAPTCSGNFLLYQGFETISTRIDRNIFAVDCWPTSFVAYDAYYSPGLCPSGWASYDGASIYHSLPTLAAGESVSICCPGGYTTLVNPDPFGFEFQPSCVSALTAAVSVKSCNECTPGFLVPTSYPGVGQVTAQALPVFVRYQKSDLAIFTAATVNDGGTPTATATSSTSTSSLSSTGGPSSKSGISTGAKIGIGVGSGLLAIAIALAISFICRYRTRQQKARRNMAPDYTPEALGPATSTATPQKIEPAKHRREPHAQPSLVDPSNNTRDDALPAANLETTGRESASEPLISSLREGPLNDSHIPVLYSPLESGYLRILEILPYHPDRKDFVCKVWPIKMDDQAAQLGYEALSYVWNQRPVSKNEKAELGLITVVNALDPGTEIPFGVSWNLMRAIKHLRKQDQSRFMWIDQICINQHKVLGPQEKNQQLPLMPKAYKQSAQVVAWLGELQDIKPLFKFVNENRSPGMPFGPVEREALLNFAKRDYWTRMWIIKELVLAPVEDTDNGMRNCLIIQCDSEIMRYDDLVSIINQVDEWVINPLDVYNIFPNIAKGSVESAVRTAITPLVILRHIAHRNASNGQERPILLRLIQFLRSWNCGEGVDRIFGLAEFVQHADFESTNPSYVLPYEPQEPMSEGDDASLAEFAKALNELQQTGKVHVLGQPLSSRPNARTTLFALVNAYAGVVTTQAELHGRLDGLNCHTSAKNPNFPTWVPDFSARSTSYSLIEMNTNRDQWFEENDGVYTTAVAKAPQIRWMKPGGIWIQGLLCDEVVDVADPFSPDFDAMTSIEKVREELLSWATHVDVWDQISSWRSSTYTSQTGFNGTVRRTAFKSWGILTSQGMLDQDEIERLDSEDDLYPNPLEQMVRTHPEAVLRVLLNRRFFKTKRGLIGVGPADTAVNDQVCMLFGGQTPYLLVPRPHEQGGWYFVGDCYVHGMMHGVVLEAWEAQKERETESDNGFEEMVFAVF